MAAPTPRPAALLGVIGGVLLAGTGLCMLVGPVWWAATFGTTTGEITSLRVESSSAEGAGHRPLVAYGYAVDGQDYVSERYDLPGTAGSESWAYGVLDRFAVGDEVAVYYDRERPGSAVLEAPVSRMSWVFGIAATVIGLGMCIASARRHA